MRYSAVTANLIDNHMSMRLLSARVRMFRNIVDSEQIDFEPDVTCLVGKNESGKTAILQALHRQNPAPSPNAFEEFDDYPRWRYVDDRREGVIAQTRPIECTFELEDEDIAAVVAELGPRVLRSRRLTRSVAYSGNAFIGFDVDEAAALINYLDRARVPDELRRLIKPGSGPEDLSDGKAFVDGLDDKRGSDLEALANQVALRFENGSAWHIAKDILKGRLPKFFYFSHYEIMPGRIDMSRLFSTSHEPGQSSVQTARALLRLAGAERDVLTAGEFEQRKAELEAISSKLSREVFRYWTQNDNLLVEIDADNAAVQNDPDHSAVLRYLDIRVRDTRHGYTSNFSQRSSGFQWFFSFLAAFSEFEDRGHGVIVLLDEPALNLHGRAQADFLRFINERLAPKFQVIYATHSPFMVEPSRLERVRVLQDKGIDAGTVVSQDIATVDSDSLLPLKAALGHDVAQNLTLGPDNELMEGTGDFSNLQTMRDYLVSTAGNGHDTLTRSRHAGGRWRFWDHEGWLRFWDREKV
jgi:predicted ATPase